MRFVKCQGKVTASSQIDVKVPCTIGTVLCQEGRRVKVQNYILVRLILILRAFWKPPFSLRITWRKVEL